MVNSQNKNIYFPNAISSDAVIIIKDIMHIIMNVTKSNIRHKTVYKNQGTGLTDEIARTVTPLPQSICKAISV